MTLETSIISACSSCGSVYRTLVLPAMGTREQMQANLGAATPAEQQIASHCAEHPGHRFVSYVATGACGSFVINAEGDWIQTQ